MLPVMLSAVSHNVYSGGSPGNPRVSEEEDIRISSAFGANEKCGPKNVTVCSSVELIQVVDGAVFSTSP